MLLVDVSFFDAAYKRDNYPQLTEFIFHTLAPAFIHAQTVASDNNPLVMAVTGTAIY